MFVRFSENRLAKMKYSATIRGVVLIASEKNQTRYIEWTRDTVGFSARSSENQTKIDVFMCGALLKL